MRVAAVLVAVLLLGPAAADPVRRTGGPVATVAQAADEVARAAKGSAKELERLAARTEPDPWLVVDELLARGEPSAAAALAAPRVRVEAEALATYVAASGKALVNAQARAAATT